MAEQTLVSQVEVRAKKASRKEKSKAQLFREEPNYSQGDYGKIDTASLMVVAEASRLGDELPDINLDDVEYRKFSKLKKCCNKKCFKSKDKNWEPSAHENVFKSSEVAQSKYPRLYKILDLKSWDFLFVFSCLASIFLFTFCEGFLIQSRVLWGLIHTVNALYSVLLLLQWIQIILKTKYAQNSFTKMDLIFSGLSVLPVDLIVLLVHSMNSDGSSEDHLTFTLSRLHYCFRIRNILNYLSNWENQLILGDFHSFLLRVLLYTAFLIHTFACIWHRLACNSFRPKHFIMEPQKAREELCVPHSWVMKLSERAATKEGEMANTPFLQSKGNSQGILWDHYLVSLYWATGTSFRLGYGDVEIDITSNPEVIFTAICQIISWIFVLAVVCGTLTSLLIESDTERESYLTRRFAIKHYLHFSKVGKAVAHEVKKFYDYLWNKRKGVSELMLIEFMPAAMKSEIFFDIHKFVLEQMPLFEDLEASFLMTLSIKMTHSFHLTGEILFEKNDRGNHMYYVLKGHLEVMSADETHAISCIRSGSAIGDVFLVHPYSHCCTVRCGSECDILALTRSSVKEVLLDYPQYFDVLQNRIQERFDQCVLLLSLAAKYDGSPQLFDQIPDEMPPPDILNEQKTSTEDVPNETTASKTESKPAYDIDSDGLSLANSIMDKMPTLFSSALAKKEKKAEKRKKSLQEEAFQAFAGDVNRTCLLAKDLGIGRAPLLVTTPIVTVPKDPANKNQGGDSEGLFTKCLEMPLKRGEESTATILCWKGFVSFCVCLTIFYYTYQFGFRTSDDDWNLKMNCVAHIADLIFAIDCWLDAMQIVVTPQKTLENFREILAYRFRSFQFYLRIFAFLPIEYIFAPAIEPKNFNSSPYLYLFKMNRIIEIVVLMSFLRVLEGLSKVPIMAVFLTKFSLATFFVIHIFAVLYEFILIDMLPLMGKELGKQRKWAEVQDSYEFIFYWATQVVTTAGFGDVTQSCELEVFVLCISFITGTIVSTYLGAKMAAILANAQRRRIGFKQTYYGVTEFLKIRKFPDDLCKRIKCYYRMQWKAHEGVLIPKERSAIWDAPEALLNQISLAQGLPYVGRVPVVKYSSDSVLKETCRALKQYFVPPDECVLFEGDMRRELYIIVKGFCNVHRGNQFVGHLTEGNYFGLAGLTMGVNQNFRITTETHCLFFCLQYDDFVEIVKAHKLLRRDYKVLRGETTFERFTNLPIDDQIRKQLKAVPPVLPPTIASLSSTLLVDDNNLMQNVDKGNVDAQKYRANEGEEFFMPDEVSSMNFQIRKKGRKGHQIFRYFLLRGTILPYGWFMVFWMSFRIFCSFAVSYFVLAQIAFAFDPKISLYTMVCFDIVAWIDLYLMFHVAYYNSLHQTVNDPIKTAKHYAKGPFILDLLFCFPFDLIAICVTPGLHIESGNYGGHFPLISLLRLNRFFQPYKLVQMGNLINNTIYKSLTFFTLVEVLPWTLFFIHFLACVSVCGVCSVKGEGGILDCSSNAWLTHGSLYLDSNNTATYDSVQNPFKMYLISFYWTIATALRVGYGDIDLMTKENRAISVVIIITGTVVTAYISSKLTACMVGEDERRIEIRTKLDIMTSFLERFKVSRSVQRRVKEVYFNEWDKTAGISVDNLFVALLPSLKADVMCHLYEDSIRQSPFLKNVDEPGIRMLSSILKEEFLVEGEYIFQYGNVTDDVFLVLSGIVGIYNLRGEIMSYLAPGSLLGEMSALYGVTRLYSAIAATDIDVLVFKAEDFLNFLEMYPELKETLEQLCVRHYQETMGNAIRMGSPMEMIAAKTNYPQPKITSTADEKGDKGVVTKDKEKEKQKEKDNKPLQKGVKKGIASLIKTKIEEPPKKPEPKVEQPVNQLNFSALDPLRVPLRKGQLSDKEKELLLQDSSPTKKWWHVFITFGRVPKTEMGALLHVFQDEKRCSCWRFTIHPASPMVRSSNWSIFNLLVVSIACSLTSYEISFTSTDDTEQWFIAGLRYCAEIFFVVRIIGNFHLGYYDDTQTLITDCNVITKRYCTRFDGLPLDLLTTLPLYAISYLVGEDAQTQNIYAANMRGIQLLRVVLFFRYLNESDTDLRMKASKVKILKITILLCFIFHFCACAWYLVACYGMECNSGSWMDVLLSRLIKSKQIQQTKDIPIGSRYFISLAYVTTTITACGFSDITPRLPIEILATVLFIFATIFVIGFLLGKMTQCLASQISRKIHYEHELSVIESHLVALGLNKSKRELVSEYYKLVWRRFQGMPFSSLLSEFPYPLRSDIAFEIYGPNIKNSRVLGKLDELILRQITARVRHEFYLPGSHIVRGGNVCDAVYFIKRGEVLIVDENMGIELCVETLYENDCFGEIKILLPREPFRFSYIARLETEIGRIDRADLDEVLQNFPSLRSDLITKATRIKSHRTDAKEQGKARQALDTKYMLESSEKAEPKSTDPKSTNKPDQKTEQILPANNMGLNSMNITSFSKIQPVITSNQKLLATDKTAELPPVKTLTLNTRRERPNEDVRPKAEIEEPSGKNTRKQQNKTVEQKKNNR